MHSAHDVRNLLVDMGLNHVDNPFKSPVTLSFCTGMRGLERGVEQALGSVWNIRDNEVESEDRSSREESVLKVAAYLEIDAFVAFNLVKQMELGMVAPAPVWTDIKTFHLVEQHFYRKVHGIMGGYPCQPFSLAGKRKGTEDPRHLWPYIKNTIGTVRPLWCFFENVPGHLELGYREVRSDLESLGYTVKEGIFSAQELGATHLRKRLFILAVANSYRDDTSARRRDYEEMFGIQKEEREPEHSAVVFGGSGEIMANTSCISGCAGGERVRWKEGSNFSRRSSWPELEHSNCEGSQREIGIGESEGLIKGSEFMANTYCFPRQLSESEGWIEETQTVWGGEPVGHSFQSRLEGYTRYGCGPEGWKITGRSIAEASLWPAPPGPDQYEWEEPRTIESGVGLTIDGYNFTEDLLRLGGNAVVSQVSQFAFLTLLEKQLR